MRKRMDPEKRFNELIVVALKLADWVHYTNLNPRKIAKNANCSPGLVYYYLGAKKTLQATVLREALDRDYERIISQAQMMGVITPDYKLTGELARCDYMCIE